MPMLTRRNTALIIGILIVVILVNGYTRQRSQQPEGGTQPDGSTGDQLEDEGTLSQEELNELKEALEELEYEDLGGLSEEGGSTGDQPGVGSLSQEDLDKLKEALEELEFDDLCGLSEEDQPN